MATSGLLREVDTIWVLLGSYATQSVNSLQTFRDNLSVPPSRVRIFLNSCLLKMGPIDFH